MTRLPLEHISIPSVKCQHDWFVHSTAFTTGTLMLSCRHCGIHGVVNDPSQTEWNRAFYSPSKPYRWDDKSRVVVRDGGKP